MRILLIKPGLGVLGQRRYRSRACLEPLALAILAAATPPHVELQAVDDRFDPIPDDQPFDAVAFSVGTFEAKRAYEIAAGFRARNIPVIMGGFHPTFCPDEVAEHADAVALGQAELIWPRIVADLEAGTLQARYHEATPPDRDNATPSHDTGTPHDDATPADDASPNHDAPPSVGLDLIPDRRILADKGYVPLAVVQFGRGCRYDCEFCSIRAFYGSTIRHRSVEAVVQEIEQSGRRFVLFVDDNLIADKARARELLHAIRPLGIRWTSQVSLDAADDEELLDLFQESGCQCVVVGIESLSDRSLRQMAKGWQRAKDHTRRLAAFRRRGIMIYGTFVLGYDDDDRQTIDETLQFALQEKLFMANFNHLQPYPGTRLYDRLCREGRLDKPKWWLDPTYRFGEAVFAPRGMSIEDLTEGTYAARSTFHSVGSILRRLFDGGANRAGLTNILTYLVANWSSRQDMQRKQGLKLGEHDRSNKEPPCT